MPDSYVVRKYKDGDVAVRGDVYGWEFANEEAFRPLQDDVMQELHEAGYADSIHVASTRIAHEVYTAKMLEEYIANYTPPGREELAEMRAAFGPGETVVNVFTGTKVTT